LDRLGTEDWTRLRCRRLDGFWLREWLVVRSLGFGVWFDGCVLAFGFWFEDSVLVRCSVLVFGLVVEVLRILEMR